MYANSREQAEQDQREGQARAAKFMTLATKLPKNHPQYWAWKNAIVNELPWPPTTTEVQNDDSNGT
jgi:hypothetical protein